MVSKYLRFCLNCYQEHYNMAIKFGSVIHLVLKFLNKMHIVQSYASPVFQANEERKVCLFVCAVSRRKTYWPMHAHAQWGRKWVGQWEMNTSWWTGTLEMTFSWPRKAQLTKCTAVPLYFTLTGEGGCLYILKGTVHQKKKILHSFIVFAVHIF